MERNMHAITLVWFLILNVCQKWSPVSAFSIGRSCHRTIHQLSETSSKTRCSSIILHSSEGDIGGVLDNQRNIRFGGIGRLFTPSKKKSDETPMNSEADSPISVVERLSKSTVLIVGLGGIGSWAAESICRSGVGNIVMIDLDDICGSNTNRQLHATSSAVGKMKIDVMKQRLLDINPECCVTLVHDFISPENIDGIFDKIPRPTACIDAIDGASNKAALIHACVARRISVVTCGASAGRVDPTKVVCVDLARVAYDRLLAACRHILRHEYDFWGKGERYVPGRTGKKPRKWKVFAVCSTEPPKEVSEDDASSFRRCDGALGTACFVTGTFGFVASSVVVDMIANDDLLIPKCCKPISSEITAGS